MSSAANATSPVVSARLIRRYPTAAEGSDPFVLDVHLEMPSGVTVLLGPSGSGKSLTLNCIAGFVNPNEGRILVHDQLFFDAAAKVSLPPDKRRCGYVFQDHALFPHMTIRENLRFAASVTPSTANRGLHLRRRINELLEVFELSDLAARKPAQLSGGEKQRAALARILMTEPRLLLLDEPTRGLDTRLRTTFYELLRETRQRLRAPALLVTHDLDECFELADFVCLMGRGRFLQSGPRDQVFSKPANAEIARSLGIYIIAPGEITALDPARNTSLLRVFEGEVEGTYFPGHLIGDHGFLCVRASEIRILPDSTRGARNQLSLLLLSSSPAVRGIRLELEHGISATVSEAEFAMLRTSSRVCLEIPPTAVYFLEK